MLSRVLYACVVKQTGRCFVDDATAAATAAAAAAVQSCQPSVLKCLFFLHSFFLSSLGQREYKSNRHRVPVGCVSYTIAGEKQKRKALLIYFLSPFLSSFVFLSFFCALKPRITPADDIVL